MKNFLFLFFLPIALFVGCSKTELYEVEAKANFKDELSHSCEGFVRIKFDTETVEMIEERGTEAFLDELAGQGVYRMERLFPDAGEMEPRQRASGLHQWYKLYYKKSIVAETKAVESLSDLFGGAVVEKSRKIKLMSIPFNDPYNFVQWNLYNTGEIFGSVKRADINVLPVWEYTGGSSDVIVSVLDSGIDMDHPDLKGVVIPGGPEGSRNFVDGSYRITDELHGTHVAGIIAAVNNNGIGVSSVAGGLDGNGGVRILLSQIFEEKEDGTEESSDEEATAEAIVWGANHGALISQNSWAFSYDSEEEARQDTNPQSLLDAIDYFIKYAGCDADGNQTGLMKGGVVFFAAGNEGWSIGHPGDYDKVIAVGAVGPSGNRASYSNYGPWVDICAPGGESNYFLPVESMILSTGNDNGFYFASGTSMSCPHASGVAALLISLYGGNGFTNADLKNMLIGGADYAYGVSEQIGPLLDAGGAMSLYGDESAPKIVDRFDGEYVIKGHETLTVTYNVISKNPDLSISVETGDWAVAEIGDRFFTVRYNDGSGTKTGKHELIVKVVSGSSLSTEKVIEYEILENHAPNIVRQADNMILEEKGKTGSVTFANLFEDQDGGKLSYWVETSGDGAVSVEFNDERAAFQFFVNGIDTVKVSATDPCGLSCSQSFLIGCYDDSTYGPAAYPNPVKDILSLCPGGSSQTKVVLSSSTGVQLCSIEQMSSVLKPIQIDMSGYAPGLYHLYVSYGGKEYDRTIVKE